MEIYRDEVHVQSISLTDRDASGVPLKPAKAWASTKLNYSLQNPATNVTNFD